MKTFTIGWLNKCRCGNKSHSVKTARGNESALWDDDAVKCNSCGRGGVIQVYEGQARVLWETDEEMAENKPMSTITKERIEQYANDPRMCNVNDEIRQIALIALASLEAESVTNEIVIPEPATHRNINEICPPGVNQTLFASGWNASRKSGMNSGRIPPIVKGIDAECMGWNACRAAMLQGGK